MDQSRAEIAYRNAERGDLSALGQLYLLAFGRSVEELRTPDLSPAALADVMAACLRADHGSIVVAETGEGERSRIIGYIVAVTNAHHVWRAALRRGLALVWMWRWVTGRYGLPLRQALGIFGDKLRLWATWRSAAYRCPARILSVAVHPDWQRRGVGKFLLDRGLLHLRDCGCTCAGLEVRSDNAAAKTLYQQSGFRSAGEFENTRGAWEVMLLTLREGAGRAPTKRGRLPRLLALALFVVALIAAHAWLVTHLRWRAALRKAGFTDEMASPEQEERILVVSPHPDDEMLGCGGLMQQAVEAGAEVRVALMTNGDASELAVIFGEKELSRSAQSYIALGRKRQQETLSALAAIGVPRQNVYLLGYPNNGLTALWRPEHWLPSQPYTSPYTHLSASPYEYTVTPHAQYCGAQVLSDLVTLLDQIRPTAIYVTHSQDIHADHWATNAFVGYALATVAARGGEWARETKVYGYLIHWPRFPVPQKLQLKRGLLPPADLHAGIEWLRLPVSEEQARAKSRCVMMYRSQMPRFDGLLKSFARTNEIFAPRPVAEMDWEVPHRWQDEDSGRRSLGGAEVTGVELTLARDRSVRGLVWTAPRPLPKRGYVALDLRAWDVIGRPVVMTLWIDADGSAEAELVTKRSRQRLPAEIRLREPGLLEFSGFTLPRSVLEKGVFVTCWGSVRDRAVDPAVVSWVDIVPVH
jgi:LmbE family N-acetylglucosaminyl deacetylase/ribosomal protein S18 acetylase RimI-like enzyme